MVVEIWIPARPGKSTEWHRSNHPITLNVIGCLLARGKCITIAKIVEAGCFVAREWTGASIMERGRDPGLLR